jgi:hypothetical protein
MKFTRDPVYTYVVTGPTSYQTITAYPEITDLLFTNASAADGSTVALPGAFNFDSTFEFDDYGWDQIFVHVHTQVLGGGGLTGVDCLIEFENPDSPGLWVPSHEPACSAVGGVEAPLRTDALAAHVWACIGVGSFIVASRKENQHITRWRARFRATAGAAGATTRIRCYWHGNGGRGAHEA